MGPTELRLCNLVGTGFFHRSKQCQHPDPRDFEGVPPFRQARGISSGEGTVCTLYAPIDSDCANFHGRGMGRWCRFHKAEQCT
jgi:hypothetical protein